MLDWQHNRCTSDGQWKVGWLVYIKRRARPNTALWLILDVPSPLLGKMLLRLIVVTRPAADAVDVYRLQGILVFHDFRVKLVLEHSERPQGRITSSETISKAKSWPASASILYRSGTCIDFTHL